MLVTNRPDPGTTPVVPGFGRFVAVSVYSESVTVAVFLLALGATARITRFINADYLFRGVRAWAIRWTGDPDHDLPYLLRCPWCASIWVAAGVSTLAWFYGNTAPFVIVCTALSVSYIYSAIGPVFDPDD